MAEQATIQTLAEIEAAHIRETYFQLGGNMTQTALALGIDRRTMYRKAVALGLKNAMPSEVARLRARVAELEGNRQARR